jgi:hypothetical protein
MASELIRRRDMPLLAQGKAQIDAPWTAELDANTFPNHHEKWSGASSRPVPARAKERPLPL